MSDFHERYEMVIGLEVHVQLKTNTKAFCRCSTNFGDSPNSNTCPVCLALPGALPVLNARAVDLAVRAALSLGCVVNHRSIFARKNYFYPDLPKGYQISQADQPLALQGSVALPDGRRIALTRIHMEEDAGKSVHDRYEGFTAIDLNRAGVPLIEIVSEPELRSSADAGAYLRALKEILLFADVSDCSMEEGSLRVDANVSARPYGQQEFNTRTEVKNVNSFSNVERALELEFARHCAVHDAGGTVIQQTMLFDAAADQVRAARSKEGSHDYRYFPEPDLPPLVLSESFVQGIKDALPEFPSSRRARYTSSFGLAAGDVEVLTATRAVGDWFEAVVARCGDGKLAANWVMGDVLATLNESGGHIAEFPVAPSQLGDLIAMIKAEAISTTAGRKVFAAMVKDGGAPKAIAETLGLLQVGDDSALESWIDEVMAELPGEAARFAAGERKLQGVLIGAVMKKSGGRADPKKLAQMLGKRAGG
ncbi:Asp-tRNA(Asn)/Glu-tRNA(Gln) amidotransferase subunit GatB [bacterium]|jgi:aspartyl-tRNA(Asn)/glutamyl-tRNA(Gln) amidotransferase subunit B|nr:Asp-tRNA(Asn)/Glu-tRNA(Gln) amidotransferase subunit GatB [bacterium]